LPVFASTVRSLSVAFPTSFGFPQVTPWIVQDIGVHPGGWSSKARATATGRDVAWRLTACTGGTDAVPEPEPPPQVEPENPQDDGDQPGGCSVSFRGSVAGGDVVLGLTLRRRVGDAMPSCSAMISRFAAVPPEPSAPPQVPPEKPHEDGTRTGSCPAANARASAAGRDSASRLISGGDDGAKPSCPASVLRSRALPEPSPAVEPPQVEPETPHEDGIKVGSDGALLDGADALLGLGVSGRAFCWGITIGPSLEEPCLNSGLLSTPVSPLALNALRTFLLAATAARLAKRAVRGEVMRRRLPSKPELSTWLSRSVESPCDTRSEAPSAESSEMIAESPHGSSSTAGSHRPEHCRAHIVMISFGIVSGILSKWWVIKLLIPPERRSSCKESRDIYEHRRDHE
jgi:hypothetical protein